MKEHFCPVEQSVITYQGECNWCGQKELAQPKPVARVIDWGVAGPKLQGLTQDWPPVGTLLYTTPPQRTWVGLDEVEIIGCTCECIDEGEFKMHCAIDFARAIEAKLKELNT